MKDKKVLLTSELFQQITNDKSEKIIDYRNKKDDMKKSIEEEKEIITELKGEIARKQEIIAESKRNRRRARIRNLIISIKLYQQRMLSAKINKKFINGEPVIRINRYYPEIKVSKKR